MAEATKTLHVKQVRSAIGRPEIQEKTLKALGLGRIGKSNDLPDNKSVRGMIFKVKHLVEVVED
jgi:large subunit ribosomal protein L30